MNFGRCLYFSTTVNCESNKLCSVALFMWWGCTLCNMIRRGAKDFSFSAVLNCNMEAAKKEYYIWVYWNCCSMNRDVTVRIVLYTSFSC